MKKFSTLIIVCGLLLMGCVILGAKAYAQNPSQNPSLPTPSAGPITADEIATIKDCKIQITPSGIANSFTVTHAGSDQIHTITWNNKRTVTFISDGHDNAGLFAPNPSHASTGPNDEARHLNSADIYQMQPAPEFDKPHRDFYMTPPVSLDNTNYTLSVFYSSPTLIPSFSGGSYTATKDGGSTLYFKVASSGDTTGPFGNYIDFIQGIGGGGKQCTKVSGSGLSLSTFTADNTSSVTPTVSITQRDQSNKTFEWFLVAFGNYRGNTGYIFRKGTANEYIMVEGDNSQLIANYDASDVGKDWDSSSKGTTVGGYVEPDTATNHPGLNHISLNAENTAASNILVNFPTALTDPPDLSGQDKNITVETQLVSAQGPYTNKELINLTDVGHTGTYNSSDGNGLHNTVYIVDKNNLTQLYSSATVPQAHIDALIDTLVVCAHKKLDQTGFASGSVALKLTDSNKVFNQSLGSIKTIGAGNIDWTSTQSPLKIDATKGGAQTCGSSDDISQVGRIIPAIGGIANPILQAIFDALRSIGTIIQNFIIYIVSWAITVASRAVPI